MWMVSSSSTRFSLVEEAAGEAEIAGGDGSYFGMERRTALIRFWVTFPFRKAACRTTP